MKKILYLTSRLPYQLEKGNKYRAYHHIRNIKERFCWQVCLRIYLQRQDTALRQRIVQELDKLSLLGPIHTRKLGVAIVASESTNTTYM